MSGVAIMVQLLLAQPAVTGIVSPESITGDVVVPLNTPLPAIGITSLSARPFKTLSQGPKQHWTERVQLTLLVAKSPDLVPLLLACAKCDRQAPQIDGVTEISVLMVEAEQEFSDQNAALRGEYLDFMVSYNVAT